MGNFHSNSSLSIWNNRGSIRWMSEVTKNGKCRFLLEGSKDSTRNFSRLLRKLQRHGGFSSLVLTLEDFDAADSREPYSKEQLYSVLANHDSLLQIKICFEINSTTCEKLFPEVELFLTTFAQVPNRKHRISLVFEWMTVTSLDQVHQLASILKKLPKDNFGLVHFDFFTIQCPGTEVGLLDPLVKAIEGFPICIPRKLGLDDLYEANMFRHLRNESSRCLLSRDCLRRYIHHHRLVPIVWLSEFLISDEDYASSVKNQTAMDNEDYKNLIRSLLSSEEIQFQLLSSRYDLMAKKSKVRVDEEGDAIEQ